MRTWRIFSRYTELLGPDRVRVAPFATAAIAGPATRYVALIAAIALLTAVASAAAETIALTGGTIHDMKGTAPYTGTVVLDGSRIAAAGADVTPPAGARVVDVTGLHVYPGIIDALSTLGLTEIGSVSATVDTKETGDLNPNTRAEVAINPDSELLPVARIAGITSALVSPQGGTIAGTSALVHMDGWTWEDMTVESPVALVVNWPSRPAWSPWDSDEETETKEKDREAKIKALKEAFGDARAYTKARQAAGEPGVPQHPQEPKWEAMVPVLEKKIPVLVKVRWADDIEQVIRWSEAEGVRLVLAGAEEAHEVVDLLKSKNIPVILDDVFDFPVRRHATYDQHFALASKLHAAGIRFALGTDGASDARNLPYQAAMAAAYGLPPDIALDAITSSVARILEFDDQVGSIAPGLFADIMVTDGSPLEITTQVKHVFIAGREIPMESRQTRLRDKYASRPRPAAAPNGPGTAAGEAKE